MITSLSINNYALIERLEMTPSPHLNIITGETGAGKSIMLGAVGLLLGNRADTKALFSEEEKCVVEAKFDVSSYKLKDFFEKEELDYDSECIIRREISPTGKSRAFINDTPVTLDVLKDLGASLLDIHSQHESLQLGTNAYQQSILDTYADHQVLIDAYQSSYKSYRQADKLLKELTSQAKASSKETGFKQFLLDELISANLKGENLEVLEEELEVLANAEEIKQNLTLLSGLLDESETSVINQLKEAIPVLSTMKGFSKNLNEIHERLAGASAEIDDIANDIRKEQDRVELDPERLAILSERVDLINRLLQKHQVKTIAELEAIQAQLDTELDQIVNIDKEIKRAEKDLAECSKKLHQAGTALSKSRKSFAEPLGNAIEKIIHQLGIENASLKFSLSPVEPTSLGLDLVEILFSANKGMAPKPLKSVASGGEFSRLIFAIKYLLADKTALPTIIFDEIDTGVSGEIAIQMINMMKQMAQRHQVISISHLPQFAAGGDAHYFVYKDHSSTKSVSKMKKLAEEDRLLAIAKMIGGDQPGEGALASARDLLLKK
jgi:DNA repair protein RecN (Recombination protein N)